MESKKSILFIIAYPMVNTIGVRRVMKTAKYFYSQGWSVNIVARELPNDFGDTLRPIVCEIPAENIHIVGDKATIIGGIASRYYPTFQWIANAVHKALEIHQREKIDCIFSSSMPMASSIVGHLVQKKTRSLWIAEFRDLWSLNMMKTANSKARRFIETVAEKYIISNANSLVTVSDQLSEDLKTIHKKDIYVIYNGFDPSDFPQKADLLPMFTITYTGSVYGKRYAKVLFEAMSLLKLREPLIYKKMKLRFIGRATQVKDELLKVEDMLNINITDAINFVDDVDYETALMMQAESALLLLLDWYDDTVGGWITGKVFDYLGSRRPILSIGISQKHAWPILNSTHSGIMFSDPENLFLWLKEKIEEYAFDPSLGFKMNQSEIEKYTRDGQSQKLFTIISSKLR